MMNSLKDSLKIAKKDLIEFSRDHLRLLAFVIMPIFMMLLVGYVFPNQNSLKEISLGVADLDKSKISKELTDTIKEISFSENKKAFILKEYNSLDELKNGIKKQEVNGGLFIPQDFSKKIIADSQAEVIIVEDQSNLQLSSLISASLSKIIEGFSKSISISKISTFISKDLGFTKGLKEKSLALIKPIEINISGIVEGETNYFEFVAPGIIAMIVMTAVLTGLASSVSREKEKGTLDGILVAPISRFSIIIGKALSQAIRGLIQGIIVMILAIAIFSVKIHGSIFLVFLLLILGIFSFVGLGILVSAIAAEQETATQILFMFQFPMLFLSGVFFPIQQMPKFMQMISKFVPLTYAVEALRKVMILGAGFDAVKLEIVVLLIFGVITLTISVPLFNKLINR